MLGHVNTCMNLAMFLRSQQLVYFIRSEQLLRERMRTTGNGITSYDYIRNEDSIVIHGSQCLMINRQCVSFVVKCMYVCN